MANVCHGQGDLPNGCCYVEGAICPLRWLQNNGRIYNHLDVDLGTPASAVQSQIGGTKAKRDRIVAAIGQRVFICSLAAKYEGNWDSVHADVAYQSQVRPAWERVEQGSGRAANTFNCGTWGPGDGQCCYAEDSVTNATKSAWMGTVAVRIDIGRKAQS